MGALVIVALVAMATFWVAAGGGTGGLVEIDEAGPRTFQFQVDVNAADWSELAQLPGIGETLARRIVESRRNEGHFQTLDDLRRVRGIGPRILERMRPYLRPLEKNNSQNTP